MTNCLLLLLEHFQELLVKCRVYVGVERELLQPPAGKPVRGRQHLNGAGTHPLGDDGARDMLVIVHEDVAPVEVG